MMLWLEETLNAIVTKAMCEHFHWQCCDWCYHLDCSDNQRRRVRP